MRISSSETRKTFWMRIDMAKNALMSTAARLVETVLFIENEALDIERLCSMTGLSEKEVAKAVDEIKDVYEERGHGIRIRENSDLSIEFAPCSDLYDLLRSTYGRKGDRRLTRAAMETLSIVAYSQPITRKEIDNIRGVASDSIVRLLREREYIKVVGRKDVQGHPCLYGTSRKFLFEFGLKSISDLPKLSNIDRLRFDKSAQESEEGENTDGK